MSEQQPGGSPLEAAWAHATSVIKEKVLMPALWRAMETGRPLAVEDGQFVVGYGLEQSYEAQLPMDSRHRNVIEQALSDALKEQVSLRVIHGTTVDEWHQIRAVEREAARLRSEPRAAPAAGGDTGWDGVSDRLIRQLMSISNRQHTSVLAEFLDWAVGEITASYGQFMPEEKEPDDPQIRSYSRLLERLADRTGVPAVYIGVLVLQRRKQAG